MATTESQQQEITKYLASVAFDKELYALLGAANESGTEPSDAGTPNETGKRKRKQPQIFKFPSPVKKSKAPVTVTKSAEKAATGSSAKSANSRRSQPARKATKRGDTKGKRRLVLEVSSESEDSDVDEGDTDYEGEGDEEEEELYEGNSTGGMRPKGFVEKGISQPPSKQDKTPGARITRSATKGPPRGHTPANQPAAQAPPPHADRVPTGPPLSAGISFEVLYFIIDTVIAYRK